MLYDKIDVIHYNRKGEKIDLFLHENKEHIKNIVEKVINETLLG